MKKSYGFFSSEIYNLTTLPEKTSTLLDDRFERESASDSHGDDRMEEQPSFSESREVIDTSEENIPEHVILPIF